MSLPTIGAALHHARTLGVDRLDAQILLGTVLGQSRAWLLAHDTDPLPVDLSARFQALLQRRTQGEPVAYLVGHKEFYGLQLSVNPGVLVPRPDTETLVDWALELIPSGSPAQEPPPRVLDLGTGSGAIALALQHQRPHAQVVAVDASPQALDVARANASHLQLPVQFRQGSWLAPVAGEVFDLIVSNPPYIEENDPHLAALTHEPIEALTSGADGLDDIREIVHEALAHLRPGGWLLLEHGHDQHDRVKDLMTHAGYCHVSARFDLAGHARCTGGQTRPD